jgi:hypothetical protein
MSWDKARSEERIRDRWEARDTEITVTKLKRDMDLENVTLKKGRLIRGAHLYATVAATGRLHLLDSDAHASSSIQRLALWQAEVSKMASAFDVPVIAFQGGRAHLLVFRPIDDDAAIARKAALLGRAISLMTHFAFNPLFNEDLRLKAKAAVDLGETVATRGGTRGDSELLFLGNAANRPAKLLGASILTATGRFVDALDDQLGVEKEEKAGEDDAWVLKLIRRTVEEEVAADGIDWTVDASKKRIEANLEKWPVDRFKVGGASALIDPTSLGRSNSKLVDAAVVLVDIDGFSDYVDQAEDDDVKRDAILALDAIRQELRAVLKTDHEGVRIQYQGDNMIGLVHLPAGDEEKIAAAAVDIAAGMQSSMDTTLPAIVPDVESLDVAVGISSARTVVSSLGAYGRRNAIVIGPAASEAEAIQQRLEAEQTGIDKTTYGALEEDVAEQFEWSASARAYVAEGLDAAKLSRIKEGSSAAAKSERSVTPGHGGRFHIGTGAAAAGGESVRPIRPYAE